MKRQQRVGILELVFYRKKLEIRHLFQFVKIKLNFLYTGYIKKSMEFTFPSDQAWSVEGVASKNCVSRQSGTNLEKNKEFERDNVLTLSG